MPRTHCTENHLGVVEGRLRKGMGLKKKGDEATGFVTPTPVTAYANKPAM